MDYKTSTLIKKMAMKKDLKQLLIKDLCSRLPYGVQVRRIKYTTDVDTIESVELLNTPLLTELETSVVILKPYLRPMSSMTEEERGEFRKAGGVMSYSPQHDTWAILAFFPEAYDWLNKNKFDYRGLIPKGLALKASEDMYK